VYDLLVDDRFPKSLRAWALLPILVMEQLEKRHHLPRFLTQPTDRKIQLHANLAPDAYSDPGNVVLDKSRFILQVWRLTTTLGMNEILAIPYKQYGEIGEHSGRVSMNYRGNWLESLLGWSQEQRRGKVPPGYNAGRVVS